MQRIELDNFRVFGSPAAFDLAPVTVLTGKNNSGKSSLIKAFLVLADYLEQDDQTVLRLDGARAIKHRINSWENLKNWKTLGLNNIQFSYVQEEFVFHYEFEEYTPNQGSLFRFRMLIKDTSEELTLTRAGYGNYTLAVTQKFINYVTANAVERARLRDTRTYIAQLEQVTARLAQLNSMLDEADANTLQQFPLLLQEKQQLTNRKKELTDVLATEKVVAGLLFQAEVCVQGLASATLPGIIQGALVNYITDSEEDESEDEDYEGEEEDWEEIGNAAHREWEEREEDFKQYAESVEQQMKELEEGGASIEQIRVLLSSIDEEPEAYVQAEDPEIEVNKTAEEIEGEIASGAFTPIREMMRKYELSKEQERQLLVHFQQVIEQQMRFSLTHLGANRTYQARLFLPGQNGSEINAIAQGFLQSELYEDGEAQAFLRKWLSSEHGFGIGDAVTVEAIEGTAIRITLYREEREVNLADLGFGAGQILTVLLQLAALIQQREARSGGDIEQQLLADINRTPTLVLIEEPEANLHPRLQSKLAELFTEVAREYALHFVLETHSEYLIRKLQLLVAQQHCAGEEIALYYLDTDSRRRIHILPTGNISEPFGSGFFDEASGETLALLRKQREAKINNLIE